jgi:tyrosyl-DNA phosphodiesterase 1
MSLPDNMQHRLPAQSERPNVKVFCIFCNVYSNNVAYRMSAAGVSFLMDIRFLHDAAPVLFDADKVILVHGMDASDMHRAILSVFDEPTRARIRSVRPTTPPYGTVHSKAVFTFCGSAGCRVFIHTANDDPSDWELRTEAGWSRDFPIKESPDARSSEFEKSLVEYFRHLHTTGRVPNAIVESAVREMERYDFSNSGCALVTSIPGKHTGPMRARFGHLRLRTLLCDEDINESANDTSVVVQFSSLGSVQPKWLDDFMVSLFSSRSRFRTGLCVKPTDRLELVLPTMAQMAGGVESWAAGRALPITGRNVHREHISSRLHGWNCSNAAERARAMPHIKSLLRYSRRNPDQLDWVLIGSANLSAAAWGTHRASSGAFDILSYEMGVLITPRLYSHQDFLIGELVPSASSSLRGRPVVLRVVGQENDPESADSAIHVPVPIPYVLPPIPYQPDDVPWHVDPGGPACASPHGPGNCLAVMTSFIQANTRATLRNSLNR